MKLTPLDIQQQQFPVRFRGFDVQEVDAFLEEMAAAFESLITENRRLEGEFERQKQESQGYREREETFKRAMIHSQKVLEQMKENARKSAELIVADAEVKAEKILQGAQNRLAQLQEDLSVLKRQRMQIEAQIQAIVTAHSRLLEVGREEMAAMDAADAKLKVLRKTS
ncbi:MAG: DivIVA domain-containing protein [Pseudomonadota bacterium]